VLSVNGRRRQEELASEDDKRYYDEEHGEDTETESIDNHRHELPLTVFDIAVFALAVFILVIHRDLRLPLLQHVKRTCIL